MGFPWMLRHPKQAWRWFSLARDAEKWWKMMPETKSEKTRHTSRWFVDLGLLVLAVLTMPELADRVAAVLPPDWLSWVLAGAAFVNRALSLMRGRV